jgi:hypothetical protein
MAGWVLLIYRPVIEPLYDQQAPFSGQPCPKKELPVTFRLAPVVLVAVLTACAPFSGTGPGTAPTAVSAAAALPAIRLQGVALVNDAPLANARLTAFDLATGRPLPLIAAGGQNLIAAGGQNLIAAGGQNYAVAQAPEAGTDVGGRFDCALAGLTPGQVVKVVATANGRTLVAVFDGSGNAIGAEASAYRLTQAAGALVVRLRLTLASTAASKAFEGAIKLQFQRTDSPEAITQVLAAARRTLGTLEQAIARKPELATRLADLVGANGEIAQTRAFTEVVAALGVVDAVAQDIKDTLRTLGTATEATVTGDLDKVTAEDFPIGTVTITEGGTYTYTDGQGEAVDGALATGRFEPTETPAPTAGTSETPAPSATPTPTAGSRRRDAADPSAGGNVEIAPGYPSNPATPEVITPPVVES